MITRVKNVMLLEMRKRLEGQNEMNFPILPFHLTVTNRRMARPY